MVYKGKSPSKMDDLGVPPFQETSKLDQNQQEARFQKLSLVWIFDLLRGVLLNGHIPELLVSIVQTDGAFVYLSWQPEISVKVPSGS